MTRQEWVDRSNEYYAKSRAAYDAGDESAGEQYERKGNACMANADYGAEPEYPQAPK